MTCNGVQRFQPYEEPQPLHLPRCRVALEVEDSTGFRNVEIYQTQCAVRHRRRPEFALTITAF